MKSLEKKLKHHLKERGWDTLRPADVAKSIMIEGAELLELFQWENLSLEEIKANKEKIAKIKQELADVLIYAIELSVLLNFNTETIIKDKLTLVEKKYPAKLMRQTQQTKDPGTQDVYKKIKQHHRATKK